MRPSRLSTTQLKKIHRLYLSGKINFMQDAITLGIARNTLKRHYRLLVQLAATMPEYIADTKTCLEHLKKRHELSYMALQLQQLLPDLINANSGKQNVKA